MKCYGWNVVYEVVYESFEDLPAIYKESHAKISDGEIRFDRTSYITTNALDISAVQNVFKEERSKYKDVRKLSVEQIAFKELHEGAYWISFIKKIEFAGALPPMR